MSSKWIILKFGGSSVGEVDHWQTIAAEVKQHIANGHRPLLVLSALKNVSNLLEALLHQALAGVHSQAISHLKELHLGFAAKLKIEILQQITPIFTDLLEDCNSVYKNQQITPKYHAKVLAVGELLSTLIGAKYLNECGINTHWQDVRHLLTLITIATNGIILLALNANILLMRQQVIDCQNAAMWLLLKVLLLLIKCKHGSARTRRL